MHVLHVLFFVNQEHGRSLISGVEELIIGNGALINRLLEVFSQILSPPPWQ